MNNQKIKLIGEYLEKNQNPERDNLNDFFKSIDLSDDEISNLEKGIINISINISSEETFNDTIELIDNCYEIGDIDKPFELPGDIQKEINTKDKNDE